MTRAFVVGNGPSLKPEQLNKLIPEVSFGVNRIHLIYDKTKWRPTNWVIMDFSNSLFYKEDIRIHAREGYPCYVRADIMVRFIERYGGEQTENIRVVKQCSHIDVERNTTQEWHFPAICQQGGSIPTAIQLAVMEGFNPIYLIGCDGDLKGNGRNHFSADYVHIDAMTVQMAMLANKTLDLAHHIAGRECKERDIKIYNATVGGSAIGGLDFYDFNDLFD